MKRTRILRWVRFRRDRRGVTLIELMVGLLVIATAAVGASIAIFNAYGQLQRQRHRLIANHYLRNEVEYWQGRVHSALPTEREISQPGPRRTVIIDPRDPSTTNDDITAEVRRGPLKPISMDYAEEYFYWEIPVTITYTEPSWVVGGEDAIVSYTLVGYWLESEARVVQD